jgi:AcrR family transcriptional regulator
MPYDNLRQRKNMDTTRIATDAAPSTKVDRRRAPKKKLKILDAAEAVFVKYGYYGASLRDIAAAARVPLALLSYHFGNKEGLFRAVIERRAPANATGMQQALHSTLTKRAGKSKLEAVLLAFIEPLVERSMRGGPGWKNYIRLMAQIANLPQQEVFVSAVPENYEGIVRSFIESIRAIYPKMAEADLQFSFYFYQAAIVHILVESGIIDRQSNSKIRSSDLDAIVPKLVRFSAAGFRAFAKNRQGS